LLVVLPDTPSATPPGAAAADEEEEEEAEEAELAEEGAEEEEGGEAEFLRMEAVKSTYCSLILAILSLWFCCNRPMACLWSSLWADSTSCTFSYFLWMLWDQTRDR